MTLFRSLNPPRSALTYPHQLLNLASPFVKNERSNCQLYSTKKLKLTVKCALTS